MKGRPAILGGYECKTCKELFPLRKQYREHRRLGCGKSRQCIAFNCPSCGEVKFGKHKTDCTADQTTIDEARQRLRKERQREREQAYNELSKETKVNLRTAVADHAAELGDDIYSQQVTAWLETLSANEKPKWPPKLRKRGTEEIYYERKALRDTALLLHDDLLAKWQTKHPPKKKKKKKTKKAARDFEMSPESAKRMRTESTSGGSKRHDLENVDASSDQVVPRGNETSAEQRNEHATAPSSAESSDGSGSSDEGNGSGNSEDDDASETDSDSGVANSDGAIETKLQGGMPYARSKSLDLLHVFTELDDWAPDNLKPDEICNLKRGASEIYAGIFAHGSDNEMPVLALHGCESAKLEPFLTGFFYRVEDFNGRSCYRKISKPGADVSFEYHHIYVFWNSAKNCWNIGRRSNDKPAMAFSDTDTYDPADASMKWMLLQMP